MNDEPTIPVLTIDGPSGVGKGTVSQLVAAALKWNSLDSGAIYRAVAVAIQRANIDAGDVNAVVACARSLDVAFTNKDESGLRVIVNQIDETDALRSEEVAAAASRLAVIPEVRFALLALQRAFKQSPGLVADGRDMGTVIFPDAQYKVFLTATAQERAKRRYQQLMGKGVSINLESLLSDIAARDARDAQRISAPLRAAVDAVLIDTTQLSIASVVSRVLALVRPCVSSGPGLL